MGKEKNQEKLRDMIRSILPSKNREAARAAKAITNRAHRRGVRIDVRHEDTDETPADLERDASHAGTVARRRGGDKLNHFMRWCEAITAGMNTQEALSYVRALLPDTLIGNHAYGHWELHRTYFWPLGKRVGGRERGSRRVQSFVDSTTFRLRRAIDGDPTLHGRLNAEIKQRKQAGEPRRLFAGAHDIETFVRAIARSHQAEAQYWYDGWPDPFAIERKVTLEFIEEREHTKGGRRGRPHCFRTCFRSQDTTPVVLYVGSQAL